MIEVTITEKTLKNGRYYSVPTVYNFYSDPSTTPLRRVVDFNVKFAECPEWFQELHTNTPERNKVLMDDWDNLRYVDYWYNIAELLTVLCVQEIDTKRMLDTNIKAGGSLATLYIQLLSSFQNYEPKDITQFTHKGTTYMLPEVAEVYGQQVYAQDISTAEAVEALMAEHVFNSVDPDTGVGHFKDAEYHVLTFVAACIGRKVLKGGKLEEKPLKSKDWDRHISKRVKQLEDLPFDTAQDVYFFLIDSKVKSWAIPTFPSCLLAQITHSKLHKFSKQQTSVNGGAGTQ